MDASQSFRAPRCWLCCAWPALALAVLTWFGVSENRAAAADKSPPLALVNARVWTGDAARPWAEALVVRGERIERVGTRDEAVADLSGERIVDVGGRVVTPGFIDAHAHLLSAAMQKYEVDLLEAGSLAEIQRRVRQFADEHPQDPWIRGRGWEYSDFPAGTLPTRADLDAVLPDRPVVLRAFDGHTAWLNSRAIALAGITAESTVTGTGQFVLDPTTGQPTGLLKESAQRLVDRVLPDRTPDERLAALREYLPRTARLGITSVHNASGGPSELALVRGLLDSGELTVRMRYYARVRPSAIADDLAAAQRLASDFRHPRLHVGGVKLWLDGVIETHTAAMLSPYTDEPTAKGALSYTDEQLDEVLRTADGAGLQVMTHAVGDRAVRQALDAWQRSGLTRPGGLRIEHIETLAEEDAARFAALGVAASMQPIHVHPTTLAPWERAVGPERAARGFAWKLLVDRGASLALGSDWPASMSFDPWRGVHLAVTRQAVDGQPAGGWQPQHCLTLETALRCFTAGGAQAGQAADELGKLAPGYCADFVVLDRDPFDTPPAELHRVSVLATFVAGQAVYCAAELERLGDVIGAGSTVARDVRADRRP